MMQVGYYRTTYREWAIARMARRAGRSVVLDIRGGAVFDFLDRNSNPISRDLFRRLLKSSGLVLVQCSAFLPELRRRYPGVAFDWFPNFVREEQCRSDPRAPFRRGDTLRTIYFGGYSRAKGIAEMIEAVTHLREAENLAVELDLAGGGRDPELDRLVAQADPQIVHDHGVLSSEELVALLRRAHVFLFPTSHFGEGHSNSANEALMHGLVVVATRHNQNPFILPADDTLWLDEKHLVPSLVEQIRFLAENPDFVNRVAQTNPRFIRERFTDRRWIPFLESKFDALREKGIPS
jgi:glycosyltransferase involved in cell wall biosynthesis